MNECTILAIDPGKVSGWAVASDKYNCSIDSCTSQEGRSFAVSWAVTVAQSFTLPLVVIAEKWSSYGRFGGARTQRGLGTAWGLWLAELERISHPKRRVVRVYPATWRAAVLGMGGRGATTEACHAAALAFVRRMEWDSDATDGDVNAAEAACIAWWGLHSREVAAVLPKKRRAA